MTDEKKFARSLGRRLKAGWTYHIWRGSVPSNRWLQPLRRRAAKYHIYLEGIMPPFQRDNLVLVAEYGSTITSVFNRKLIPEHSIFMHRDAAIDLLGVRCWSLCDGRFEKIVIDTRFRITKSMRAHFAAQVRCSRCAKIVLRFPCREPVKSKKI